MTGVQSDGESIVTGRLTLTALTVHDADEMVAVLNDERLHAFVGGRPDTITELRDRYRRFVAGPKESDDVWLNWIVRSTHDGAAIGTVQATISTLSDARKVADVAWVIGIAWQGRGYASEAVRAVIDWLRAPGVDEVTAAIHDDHRASTNVASRAGLHPTEERVHGETLWRLTLTQQGS